MATEMNVEAERAAFEAWYVAAAGESRKFMLGRNTDGTYSYVETESMWEAWQGRAAQPADVEVTLPELPEPDGSSSVPIDESKFTFTEVDAWSKPLVLQYARDAIAVDRRARGHAAIQEMVDIAQDLDMGYGPPASAAQGVKTLPEDLLDELNDAVIEALNQAFAMKDWGARDHWRDVLTRFEDWRAAPPLSSEPQESA